MVIIQFKSYNRLIITAWSRRRAHSSYFCGTKIRTFSETTKQII